MRHWRYSQPRQSMTWPEAVAFGFAREPAMSRPSLGATLPEPGCRDFEWRSLSLPEPRFLEGTRRLPSRAQGRFRLLRHAAPFSIAQIAKKETRFYPPPHSS